MEGRIPQKYRDKPSAARTPRRADLTCDLVCVLVDDVIDLVLLVVDFVRNRLRVLEDVHDLVELLLLVLHDLVLGLAAGPTVSLNMSAIWMSAFMDSMSLMRFMSIVLYPVNFLMRALLFLMFVRQRIALSLLPAFLATSASLYSWATLDSRSAICFSFCAMDFSSFSLDSSWFFSRFNFSSRFCSSGLIFFFFFPNSLPNIYL